MESAKRVLRGRKNFCISLELFYDFWLKRTKCGIITFREPSKACGKNSRLRKRRAVSSNSKVQATAVSRWQRRATVSNSFGLGRILLHVVESRTTVYNSTTFIFSIREMTLRKKHNLHDSIVGITTHRRACVRRACKIRVKWF